MEKRWWLKLWSPVEGIQRKLSGVNGVDPLLVSVDRHTPQHCSVLSRPDVLDQMCSVRALRRA
jgi:hypothetical protein